MTKKKADRGRPPGRGARRKSPRVVAAALTLGVVASAMALTAVRPWWTRPAPPSASMPAAQGQLPLAREYVYVDGKLVATEEPPPLTAGPPPTNLSATATSATAARLTWAAPAGQVTKYKVERRRAGTSFAEIVEVTAGAPSMVFDDGGLTADTAYLYQVRAVFAGGGLSAYSNTDLATTVVFEDDPLVAGLTNVRFRHVEQVRAAVNAVRALAGLGDADWSSTPPAQQLGPIHRKHVKDLRDHLDPALSALGLPVVGADSTLAVGLPVKASHIQDVRQKVK